jgi:Mg-chelatase subunit ChlD
VARAEAAHDLHAIRDVFDRIGGRTPLPSAIRKDFGGTEKQDFARTFQMPLTDGVAS